MNWRGFGLVLGLAVPAVVHAQGPASVTALAEISDAVLSVTPQQDLTFGAVTPGLPTTIDPQVSLSAGKFELRGARGAEVSVTFALPATLDVGPHAMPITFGATGGCRLTRDQQDKCAYFDPSVPLIEKIHNKPFPDNLLIIWIGGTVSPGVAQFPGIYRGTITLTAAYTGN